MGLHLYRRGKVWHYRGTVGPDGNRRPFRGSCYTEIKDDAARQIAEIEARYWKGNFDGPEAILTFAEAVRKYRAAGKSTQLGRWCGFLDKIEKYFGNTLVKDISEGAIHEMAMALWPEATGASRNRMAIVPAQAIINHAAKSKLCQQIRVERYKVDAKVKEPVTPEWIAKFSEHASQRLSALALFMYLTGARVGEALDVQWDDITLQGPKPTVLIRESKQSKERVSHLPLPLVVALANLERIEGRGVFGYAHGVDLMETWDRAIKRAGIKRLTPHSCRHGFATDLLRGGVDVVTVAWLGGWRSAAQVLKTYGHANKNPCLTDLLAKSFEHPMEKAA